MSWEPSSTPTVWKLRADMLRRIRQFFFDRKVLEVETPLLAKTVATDPYIQHLSVSNVLGEADNTVYYLQTSPEFPMKRLLAAGSGSIYQIGKAFRQSEQGRHHNPEFTMLEWYREGFDHYALMDEVAELMLHFFPGISDERFTYQQLFLDYLQIDPLAVPDDVLRRCAASKGILNTETLTRDDCLQQLMSQVIEPNLGRYGPTFIYEYPASQAALAKLSPKNPAVAERFEMYLQGMELANGYHELIDPDEQARRFEKDIQAREALALPAVPADERLIAAQRSGMPTCAGVALGLDRLLMLLAEVDSIEETLMFPIHRA